MIYLVMPTGAMRWNDLPGDLALTAAPERGVDLANVDGWGPSDHRVDEAIIGLALRYGVQSAEGIVLDGQQVVVWHRPALLTETHENAVRAHAELHRTQGAFLEHVMPGSGEYDRQLQASIDETHETTLAEAVADLDQLLRDRAPDPDLVTHWTRLGGRVPQN